MSLCLSPPPLTLPLAENSPRQNLAPRARGSDCRVWSEGPVGDCGELRQGTEDAANKGGGDRKLSYLSQLWVYPFCESLLLNVFSFICRKEERKKKHRLSEKKKGGSVDICVRACVRLRSDVAMREYRSCQMYGSSSNRTWKGGARTLWWIPAHTTLQSLWLTGWQSKHVRLCLFGYQAHTHTHTHTHTHIHTHTKRKWCFEW